MIFFRSLLFNLFFYAWTPFLGLIGAPMLVTRRGARNVIRTWAFVTIHALKPFCNIDYAVRGLEHRPGAPCIYAVKHQSAWETMALWLIFKRIVFVIKQELADTPIIGWHLRRSGQIAVNRKAGVSAMKKMLAEAKLALAQNYSIIIYPEGTRTEPGADPVYHPGVAMLYEKLGVPVVPVALNSGRHWGRRLFFKPPGTITVELLPAIAPGLPPREFLALLKERIETAVKQMGI